MYCASEDEEQQQLLPISCQADNKQCAACKQEGYCVKIHFDEVIFSASCMTLLIVLQLPIASYHGKPVPVFVFTGLPPAFHAFLICLMGACYSSVCSIHIRKTQPKLARFYYAFAVLSMFASFAITFCCAMWEMYKALPTVFSGSTAA